MNHLEILAVVGSQVGKISSIVIISLTGLAVLATIIFLVVGIIQQNKYDNDSLPTFAELNPDVEESMIEIDDEEVVSAFRFEDDEIDSEPIGHTAADEILKDMRAVELAPPKTKRFGIF